MATARRRRIVLDDEDDDGDDDADILTGMGMGAGPSSVRSSSNSTRNNGPTASTAPHAGAGLSPPAKARRRVVVESDEDEEVNASGSTTWRTPARPSPSPSVTAFKTPPSRRLGANDALWEAVPPSSDDGPDVATDAPHNDDAHAGAGVLDLAAQQRAQVRAESVRLPPLAQRTNPCTGAAGPRATPVCSSAAKVSALGLPRPALGARAALAVAQAHRAPHRAAG